MLNITFALISLFLATESVAYSASCDDLSEGHRLEKGFYPDGARQSEQCFEGDRADGPYRVWHQNGQIKSEGQYHQGEMTGHWTRWFENGNKRDEGEWAEDQPTGV